MAAVRGFAHPADTFQITVAVNTASSSYIQDNGCDIGSGGFGAWYTATDKMAIRMNFGTLPSNIEDSEGNIDFNIYPNPTNGLFVISTEDKNTCIVSITNVLGQEIISLNHDGLNPLTIDLNNYESGIYTVKLSYKDKISTKSIILE
jgi:hypothetical protein